jgi:undecaprenyl-diphosphatase
LIFWASSIAYGQVYVGVHYPLDVISGAMVGMIVGILVASWYDSFQDKKIAFS